MTKKAKRPNEITHFCVQRIHCECGITYAIYVPPKMIREALIETESAPLIPLLADFGSDDPFDGLEVAEFLGSCLENGLADRLIDARETDEVQCPCGKLINWRVALRVKFRGDGDVWTNDETGKTHQNWWLKKDWR